MIGVLIILAIAPAIAIAIFIYYKDQYEKEPWHMLVKAFAGGVFITLLAGTAEWAFESFIRHSHAIGWALFEAFLVIALIEEGGKYYLLTHDIYHSKEFNEPFDGITYSVMISMGFATVENIFYVLEGGIETAILRMLTAVPVHGIYGILMGFYVGLAKFRPNPDYLRRKGLFLALIFHGAYDFFLLQKSYPFLKLGTFAVLIIGVLLSFKGIRILNNISPFKNGGTPPPADEELANPEQES